MFATSSDGTQIYYETTGAGDTALVCVHGWRGNVRWWDSTRDALASDYQFVALDLAGHGQSGAPRMPGSSDAYAADIVAVAEQLTAKRIVLVGHSMSGAYVLVAAPELPTLAAVILVDTVKNVESVIPPEQMAQMFALYRADFPSAVANVLPKFLYAPETPQPVIDRLAREFTAVSGEVAVALLEPLYHTDLRAAARGVKVPVRGIGSNLQPDTTDVNRQYFADYAYRALPGTGHYPMLEVPEAFDAALREDLAGCL